MSALPFRVLLCAFAVALAPAVAAQVAPPLATDAPRVLFDVTDRVKADEGGLVVRRTTLVYDPQAGEYVRTVRDGDGAVLSRVVDTATNVGPSADEDAAARALISADPEVSTLLARSRRPTLVMGGFSLVREAGHPCGPGSRCLQYDVLATGGAAAPERIRFVVVDLRTMTVVSNDFDPAAEGNLAHPVTRRQSRSR